MKMNEKIRYLREEKGVTQAQIADALKINRVTYTNYELGKRTPDVYMLKKIADHLGITLDELFSGKL
jgi:transcriptional regulator with XRE-family HTH domain